MPSMGDRASRWYDHFLTGALVPLGIATEPALRGWIAGHKFEPSVSQGLSLAVFYTAAIILLWGFGEFLENYRRKSERLRLAEAVSLSEKIGEVDGDWIDAIYENGRLIQGSTITFDSTNKKEFTISGFTYNFDSENEKLSDKPHDFAATETMLLTKSVGIGYVFEGTEVEGPKKDRHDGAGFYKFKMSAKGEKLFTGAFFVESKKYIRTVDGKMIGLGKSDQEKKELLREYMLELKRQAPAPKQAKAAAGPISAATQTATSDASNASAPSAAPEANPAAPSSPTSRV